MTNWRLRMSHVITVLLFVVISVSMVPFSTAETGVQNEIIIVENDWPPFLLGKSNETFPGFAKELLTTCISKTDYKPVFIFFPIKRMFAYLKTGEADLAIFSHKKARESFLLYGKTPLFTTGYRPIVRADSNIQIQTLADFDKLRLGHLAGLKYSPKFYEYITKREKSSNLITTTMGNSTQKMLLEGIIDIYVDTRESALWRAKQHNVEDQIRILDFDIKTSNYFVTISKKSPRITSQSKLLDSIDSCVTNLRTTGRYDIIAAKYGIQ